MKRTNKYLLWAKFTAVHALWREVSVLLVERHSMKAELKYVVVVGGGQSVMMAGMH